MIQFPTIYNAFQFVIYTQRSLIAFVVLFGSASVFLIDFIYHKRSFCDASSRPLIPFQHITEIDARENNDF